MIDQELDFHPVADIFPMMSGDEYSGLITDIQENGLLEPIWLHSDGRIIDGRNRYRACLEGGVEPDFRTYEGPESQLVAFVISLNLHRRHLDSGQLAFVALAIESYERRNAKERQRGAGGDRKSEAYKQSLVGFICDCGADFDREVWHCPNDAHHWPFSRDYCSNCHERYEDLFPQGMTEGQRALAALEIEQREQESVTEIIQEPIDKNKSMSSYKAAQSVGTNAHYVSDAKAIRKKAPELEQEVMNGSLSLPQAKQASKLDQETRKVVVEKVKEGKAKNVKQAINQVKEAKREERRAANKEKIQGTEQARVEVMDAKFATIVADPPWSPESVGVVDVVGRSNPTYATMGAQEIADLKCWDKPVRELSDVDAHLYLWVVNRSFDHGFKIMETWGFRFVTVITWCKPSIGLGNYFRNNTEHILFGVKGSQPLKRRDMGTWFEAKRGPKGHSSKPPEFYEIVESCSPGPYLEIFSRRESDGWTSWGEDS